MALTRRLLKGMGLTEEQVDTIIEAHTDTVDGLKDQVETYKADAEKLPAVQKELDDLKAAGDGGYKEKYEKEHKAYEDYKAGITAKETRAAKEAAVKAYLESKNIQGGNLTIAMRGLSAEIDATELDGGNIKDTKALDDLISGDLAGLVTKTTEASAPNPASPPSNAGGTMTKDQIFEIKDRAQRRAAIAANMNLFEKGEKT